MAVREQQQVVRLAGAEVAVLVCSPAGAARAPAVLFFHGLGVDRNVHRKEGRALAEAGLVAVLPDAPHHGERRDALVDEIRRASGADVDRLLIRLVEDGAAEVPALVDHLLAAGHPAVAVAGISMGAYIALAAAANEPRLAAIASLLGSPDWTPDDGVVPPGLAPAVARAPIHRLDRFPPRPLLLINCGRDVNVPPAPARRFAAALRPLYEAAGAPGRLLHREYPDSDHFPGERDWHDLWATTVDFLVTALR